MSGELQKLIDRENELLARGFSDRSMDGLRKRITNLFLQYIKLPMVNPAAARFSKVSGDSSVSAVLFYSTYKLIYVSLLHGVENLWSILLNAEFNQMTVVYHRL